MSLSKQSNIVRIIGKVESNYDRRAEGFRVLKVYTSKQKKTHTVIVPHNIFCPVSEGDAIDALCNIDNHPRYGTQLKVVSPPFVELGVDRSTVVRCFIRALKGTGLGNIKSNRLYERFLKNGGGDEKSTVAYITELSYRYMRDKDVTFYGLYDDIITEKQIDKLMKWWYKQRSLRRLYLLGLNNREIKSIRRRSLDQIYDQCIKNPFVIPEIPLDKCISILKRLHRNIPEEDVRRGQIVRKIHDFNENNGWTGIPSGLMMKMFPDLTYHIETLYRDYYVKGELRTIYLEYPYNVECKMARKLTKIAKSTFVPCPNKYGDANFMRKNLTDEQKRAVQCALDYKVSIITGGPGTGKCLDPDTPVLMFDGSIKPVKMIKAGEQVMGPYSKPKNVLSTSTGNDTMYRIVPSKGRPFICNEPHILTLVGIKPCVSIVKNHLKSYMVTYTERGIMTRKYFNTKEKALKFKNNLKDDIFDIPLNEYLQRDQSEQNKCYIFHTGVEFDIRDVPIDPYLIGYWLGVCSNSDIEAVLGDEHSDRSTINTDKEIVDVFTIELSKYNLELQHIGDSKYITQRDDSYRQNDTDRFTGVLSDLNLINNKHIPNLYKINSREKRLQLLAGIIDANASQINNYIEITHKSKKLIEDIEYLCLSLGFMVTYREIKKNKTGVYHRLNIFGEGMEHIPVVLDRKRCNKTESQTRATCLRFKIEKLGIGKYCGFELDGDGRFLLGDFTVTHNTTIISEIVHNLELRDINYTVASYTGKAVARLREVIGKRTPSTMHKMISTRSSIEEFKHLIIDEVSMVTLELLYEFMEVFNYDFHITLVGDIDQLQPIGWGNLFGETLKSQLIPTTRLTKNHRVIPGFALNGITINARAMKIYDPDEDFDSFQFKQTENFQILPGNVDFIYDIINSLKKSAISSDNVTIICPYNKPLDNINKTCQQIFNDGQEYVVDSRYKLWMVNDRVMMIENNYDINIMNGEEGFVKSVSLDDNTIDVEFKGHGIHTFKLEPTQKKVTDIEWQGFYGGENYIEDGELTVKQLRHSFAITTHKSQGSEWDYVIFYVPEHSNNKNFITKNLVYTAITRAKIAVWCVGDIPALTAGAVRPPKYRCDNLCERMVKYIQDNVDLDDLDDDCKIIDLEESSPERAPVVSRAVGETNEVSVTSTDIVPATF